MDFIDEKQIGQGLVEALVQRIPELVTLPKLLASGVVAVQLANISGVIAGVKLESVSGKITLSLVARE